MDLVDKIIELTDLFDDNVVTTGDKIPQPEPRKEVVDREAINRFMKNNPMAYGGRINFDKGGAAKFREFIKDFDGKIYKGFVSDQANKFNIDRSTAGDIIEALRSDIRKKLVERNYDVTKSQVEGGKSYADKIKERKDRVAKENVNTPTDDEFKKLSEDFSKDSKYKIKTNKNFAKYLNDKGKTAFGGLKFNEDAVGRRLSRVGLTSAATTESLVNKNFKELKKIATEIGVSNVDNIKDRKKLLTKIYERRASEIKKFKRATDPEFQAAEKKTRDKYVKANPEKVKKASQNARLKNAEKFGFPPPAFSEEEELWRSLFVDGRKYKEGRRLKTIGLEKYGAFVPRDEFLNAKILDTKTNKIITFGKNGKNLKNYINKNTSYKYEKVLQPYAQKWFINNTEGLRTEINSKLIKNYKPGSVDNFFEIQHNAGRYNDPFDVSLTNQDVNLKESTARRRFDKAWSMSKSLSDKKKAFQSYTNTLPKEVLSKPGMVKRARYFGEEIPFEQQLRDLKQKGVNLPRGTLKKAAEMSGLQLSANPFFSPGVLKEGLKMFPTFTGGAVLNAALGVDPTSAIDRAGVAAEAAFAPQLVKQAAKFGPVTQRFLNLGLSPALAARVARVASPIGLASLAAEGAYQAGKFTKKRIGELKAMSPEERAELRQKGEAFAFDPFQAAGGGIAKLAGDPSGAMLESMNPDSQGLSSLMKRGTNI